MPSQCTDHGTLSLGLHEISAEVSSSVRNRSICKLDEFDQLVRRRDSESLRGKIVGRDTPGRRRHFRGKQACAALAQFLEMIGHITGSHTAQDSHCLGTQGTYPVARDEYIHPVAVSYSSCCDKEPQRGLCRILHACCHMYK